VAVLPPGAFIIAGLMIAAKNLIDASVKRRTAARGEQVGATARRVRVTGTIN